MWKQYLLLTFAMLFFSGNFIVGKAFAGEIPPFTLAMLRWAFGLLFLLPFTWKELIRMRKIRPVEWLPLLGLSLTGLVFFNALLYLSVNYTSSINAAIVDASTPVVAAVLGFFLLRERLSLRQWTGIVLSLGGVLWIITKGSWERLLSLTFNIGDLIMFVAIVFWALYSILIKRHGRQYPTYAGLVITMGLAVLMLLPFSFWEWQQGYRIEWNPSVVLGLLYIGLFPSALAFVFWNQGVAAIGPSRASVFFNLVPIFTTGAAVAFLQETAVPSQFLGGLLVLIGVYFTNSSRNEKTPVPFLGKSETP